MHLVRHIKSSASESKPIQSRGEDGREERPSRSKLKQAFLIDAELLVYLIQWKVRRLNRALLTE